jgi:CNP1-like family
MAAATVLAQPAPGDGAPGDDLDGKPWQELKTLLPTYPRADNLVRIYVGPTTPFEFYVDTSSLNVTGTGTIRFTLVARSPSGAMNVSYDGIRCDSREHRSYAFGQFDGTWLQARNSQWVPISRAQANSQYAALADDIFCPEGSRVRTVAEAVQALRRENGLANSR